MCLSMFFQGEFSDFSVESGHKGRPSEVKKKLQTDRPHQSRTRYNTHNFLRGPPLLFVQLSRLWSMSMDKTRHVTMLSAFAATIVGYQLTVIRTSLATSSSNNEPHKKVPSSFLPFVPALIYYYFVYAASLHVSHSLVSSITGHALRFIFFSKNSEL